MCAVIDSRHGQNEVTTSVKTFGEALGIVSRHLGVAVKTLKAAAMQFYVNVKACTQEITPEKITDEHRPAKVVITSVSDAPVKRSAKVTFEVSESWGKAPLRFTVASCDQRDTTTGEMQKRYRLLVGRSETITRKANVCVDVKPKRTWKREKSKA